MLGGAVGPADASEAPLEDATVEVPRDHAARDAAPEAVPALEEVLPGPLDAPIEGHSSSAYKGDSAGERARYAAASPGRGQRGSRAEGMETVQVALAQRLQRARSNSGPGRQEDLTTAVGFQCVGAAVAGASGLVAAWRERERRNDSRGGLLRGLIKVGRSPLTPVPPGPTVSR